MNGEFSDFTLCVLAVLCSMAAGVSAYLVAPRQLVLRKALSARAGFGVAVASGVAALWLFCQVAGVLTSVFALVMVLMSIWSFLPLCVALVRGGKGDG